MSRTDKTNPEWVKALHADRDGRATETHHSTRCADYVHPLYGWGPTDYVVMRVDRAVAEANGWPPAPFWARETGPTVVVNVPRAPHACNVDSPTGNCRRYIVGRDRRILCSCCAPPANPRRRAAERDWLREAAKEYNAFASTGGFDADPDWEPTTRGIHEAKTPWQGRYVTY